MSYLLSKPKQTGDQGCIQCINPSNAKWDYVGFEVFQLGAGETLEHPTQSNEVCMVIVGGKASVSSNQEHWPELGERSGPFDNQAPYAVYLPPEDCFKVQALSDLEIAFCKAPASGEYPARLIRPQDCQREVRGEGSNQRHVCNILFNNLPAEKLLVVEVVTPNGNWSSYPPHKHDADTPPQETRLEETYYHRVKPPQGFAFQRVYTDDRRIDETMTVEDKCVVKVPEGYHPVGAAHGYDLYYLNVMAGPSRQWIFHNDPEHEWMISPKYTQNT